MLDDSRQQQGQAKAVGKIGFDCAQRVLQGVSEMQIHDKGI